VLADQHYAPHGCHPGPPVQAWRAVEGKTSSFQRSRNSSPSNVEASIVVALFAEDLFVDAGSVGTPIEIVGDRRAVPANVEGKLLSTARLRERWIDRATGPRVPWTESSPRRRTARTVEGNHCARPCAVAVPVALRSRAIRPRLLPATRSSWMWRTSSIGTTAGRPACLGRFDCGWAGRRCSTIRRFRSSTGINLDPQGISTVSRSGSTPGVLRGRDP